MRKKRPSAHMRKPVEIISSGSVPDGMGGEIESDPVVFHGCRAAIWPVKATEQIKNMREELEVTHRIRIRYYPGISPSMTVKYGTRTFEIVSIINVDEANKLLDLVSKEHV